MSICNSFCDSRPCNYLTTACNPRNLCHPWSESEKQAVKQFAVSLASNFAYGFTAGVLLTHAVAGGVAAGAVSVVALSIHAFASGLINALGWSREEENKQTGKKTYWIDWKLSIIQHSVCYSASALLLNTVMPYRVDVLADTIFRIVWNVLFRLETGFTDLPHRHTSTFSTVFITRA